MAGKDYRDSGKPFPSDGHYHLLAEDSPRISLPGRLLGNLSQAQNDTLLLQAWRRQLLAGIEGQRFLTTSDAKKSMPALRLALEIGSSRLGLYL